MSKNHSLDVQALKMPIIIAMIALIVRILLIAWMPDAYQFDAYQRWAGRDHLYIQVWLPATQTLVWLVGKIGGTPLILRLVFSMLGALTIGMMVRWLGLCERVLRKSPVRWLRQILKIGCGYLFPLLCLDRMSYGPRYLIRNPHCYCFCWRIAPHRIKPEWGDVCIGALALVRYEGWLSLWFMVAEEKLKAVLLSSWGIVAWLSIKHFGWLTPYMASPDSFSDWNELSSNLNPRKAKHLARQLWLMFDSSAAGWFLLAATPMLTRWRKWDYRHWMLFWAFWGQCAALVGWLFSLGIAFSRMMVLPVMILAPLSILGLRWAWNRWKDTLWKRNLFCIALVTISGWTMRDIYIDITSL